MNLVIDIWFNNELVQTFNEVRDEYTQGRYAFIEAFYQKEEMGISIWFE